MERLTKRNEDGSVGISEFRYYNYRDFQKLASKLAEYEDLEEQGLLVRLPCKVGDYIYVIPSQVNYNLNVLNGYSELNKVYKQLVNSIELFKDKSYVLTTCDGLQSVISNFYKETWFLTKEEAEQALEKMEKEV